MNHSRCKYLLVLAALLTPLTSVCAAEAPPAQKQWRIIAFGAHPDDAEFKAGGTSILWSRLGYAVRLVSMTNGDLGHFEMGGGPLAMRRTAEVEEAARVLGVEAQVVDIHDGELMPDLETRKRMSRLIEEWQADVVISHRPYDYNPDHRAVGKLAHDTAFMVSVPFWTPDAPATEDNPIYLHFSDFFERPVPFQPDIVVSIDEVFEQKIDAIDKIVSQVYEVSWANLGRERRELVRSVPQDPADRRVWLAERHGARYAAVADRYRDALIRLYGEEKGNAVRYAEAFQICQYGRRPTVEEIRELFPFLGR